MKDIALGLRDGGRGARLVSIQADLTQDCPSEEGSDTNPLAIGPFEQHRHPTRQDQEDARSGISLPHQLLAGGNGAGHQIGGELIGEATRQRWLLVLPCARKGEETILAPRHSMIEVGLVPDHLVVVGDEVRKLPHVGPGSAR